MTQLPHVRRQPSMLLTSKETVLDLFSKFHSLLLLKFCFVFLWGFSLAIKGGSFLLSFRTRQAKFDYELHEFPTKPTGFLRQRNNPLIRVIIIGRLIKQTWKDKHETATKKPICYGFDKKARTTQTLQASCK